MGEATEADLVDRVRRALRTHLPSHDSPAIVRLGAGHENVAFDVGGTLIVRVRRSVDGADGALAIEHEAALLDAVGRIATLPVPAIVFGDRDAGILAYRKLPGRALLGRRVRSARRLAAELGRFLSGLHRMPTTALAALVPRDDDPLADWRAGAVAEYAEVGPMLAADARRAIERFLAAPAPPDPDPERAVLCHNDLGAEHILADASTGAVTGIIDWSDAAIADPLHDLGRLYRDFGPAFVRELLAHYDGRGDRTDWDRIRFYARCALIEDLAFGRRWGARAYLDAALANLARTFK